MMQLLCSGVRLDLPDDAGLQFTHKNPLFAFDRMECERTTSFSLPATATNDRVLSVARVPAYAGAGMRVRFAAQLIDGTMVKNGYLYVTEWTGDAYNAIFVCGDFLGLQAIREVGKVSELGLAYAYKTWGAASSSANRELFDVWGYGQKYGGSQFVPAINLATLINVAAAAAGVSVYPAGGEWYMICKKPIVPHGELSVTMEGGGMSTDYNTQSAANALTPTNNPSILGILDITQAKIRYKATNVPNYLYGYMKQFVCNTNDIQLTFADDIDSGWVCVSFPEDCGQYPEDDPEVYKPGGADIPWTYGVFLGDYYFHPGTQDYELIFSGTPLAGRTIDIPAGTPFVLLNATNMFDFFVNGATGWYNMSWQSPIMYNVPERKAVPGDIIEMTDNLPNLTLLDLMKIYATLTGKVLNYDLTSGQTYDALNFATWSSMDVSQRLLKRETVARKFADYAQANIVQFEGDDTQLDGDHITRVYDIYNDNIEAEKVLQKMPLSEGSVNEPSTAVYIRNTADDLAPSAYVIGKVISNNSLQRVTLPQITGLQNLCTASTQYKVQVRMTLLEYNAITEKTLLMIDGSKYVWTERNWQADTAVFTLAKVS